jgi:DNA-binding MarR family transcriptional regulator
MAAPQRTDPLIITLFSEIAMNEQMARVRLSRALPRGMELSHFTLLNHFARLGGEKSPAQLARLFHLTKGALTNTLARLEKQGYLTVRPHPEDGRKKVVSISDEGRRAVDAASEAVEPVFRATLEAMGQDRVRAALPFLRELRAALSQ